LWSKHKPNTTLTKVEMSNTWAVLQENGNV
jgi:hypothetical protein